MAIERGSTCCRSPRACCFPCPHICPHNLQHPFWPPSPAKPSQHSTPDLSEATPGCSRQPTCPPASKALLSTMPGPGPRIQGQKLPPSVPHLAPSPCPNHAPGRFAGPQTSSSLALGLRSSLRTHLAPLVGNPLVSDLTGPQVTSRAWTGFGPQLYPHPHLGPVAW